MNETKRIATFFVLSAAIMFGWSHFFPAPKSIEKSEPQNSTKEIPSTVATPASNLEAKSNSDEISVLTSLDLEGEDGVIRVYNDYSFEFVSLKNDKLNLNLFFKGSSRKFSFFKSTQLGHLKRNSSGAIEIYNSGVDSKPVLSISNAVNGSFSILFNDPTVLNVSFENTLIDEKSEMKRSFVYLSKELQAVPAGDEKIDDQEVKWFGLDYNYHLLAFTFEGKQQSKINASKNGQCTVVSLAPINKISFIFVQKDYDLLVKKGNNLELSIDYGMWSLIAIPMLRVLQFFYNFIPNYGVSIILLTILMRLLTFPLQWKSFKSMKRMQDIQPEIQKLRERFKDDPQALNRETMNLFKRSGANPLGGCLPLLLQMPIFFAMYKVLQNSSELVHSPFIFWLKDLSTKDPIYVLPVVLSIVMFLQQKLTPTTVADPAQKKILMFMPLIFGFFMKDLPSGLCLYIIISTIVGIFQQMIVYKFIK